jgi:hypothetical protein
MPVELHGQILEVLVHKGQEPVDAAFNFCEENGLPHWFREAIVKQLCEQPALDCQRTVPLLLARRIQSENGRELGTVQFLEGVEPAHEVERFCEQHSIAGWYCQLMLDEVCAHKRLQDSCNERELVLFQNTIQTAEFNAELLIMGHQSPEDAVTAFCKKHSIPLRGPFCNQLMQTVCADIEMRCGVSDSDRAAATSPGAAASAQEVAPGGLILDSPINSEDGNMVGMLQIRLGEEPADIVVAFSRENALPAWFRRAITSRLCDADTGEIRQYCTRPHGLLFARELALEDGTVVSADSEGADATLRIFDDGTEPADVVHAFCEAAGVNEGGEKHVPGFATAVVQTVCADEIALANGLVCSRLRPAVFRQPIASEHGATV